MAIDNANAWRAKAQDAAKAAAVELALPSGAVILARRPDALHLATWNRLPMQLAGAVVGGNSAEPSLDDAIGAVEAIKQLLLFCCISPRVSTTDEGADVIHPRDIPNDDFNFIISWAMRAKEAAALQPFRGGAAVPGAGGDGQSVRDEAIDAVGDRG